VRPLLLRLNRPVAAVLLVTALAGFIRFAHLRHPVDTVFDEVYYPKAACILVGWDNETCHIDSSDERYWRDTKWDVGSWVHPPLGKWQIALGIKAFGMNSFGWRFTTALAGTMVVFFTAILAQLLFANPVWTYVAGGLLAIEDLNVVMSRTALLDTHLELWVVLGFLFLVLDRRWIERRQARDPQPTEEAPDPPPARTFSPVWRPWRLAAGAALGAACAVKWSGAYALATAVLIAFVWEIVRRHRHDVSWTRAVGRTIVRESFGLVLAFLVVPVAVFVLTWVPWLHHFDWSVSAWRDNLAAAWRYQKNGIPRFVTDPDTHQLKLGHAYYSLWWTWPLLLRPVSFYLKDVGSSVQQVLAIGNPGIFWAGIVAFPFAAFAWRRLRDWRAGFVLLAYLGQWLPWGAVSRGEFFFYILPATPFLVLAVTYMLQQLSDARLIVREPGTRDVAVNPVTGGPAISTAYVYRPFVWAYLIATAALFLLEWPVLSAGQITDLHQRAIVWFRGWF
jgi:dolichyl-phosphate-mannose-protein mannosyltransferase